MPYKEKEIEKLYYTIGEVADMFGVNTSLIRFWEKEFEILQPKKNRKGNRLFTSQDVENLKRIYNLVKEKGYKLEGAKQVLNAKKSESNEVSEIIERLQTIKEKLINIRDSI